MQWSSSEDPYSQNGDMKIDFSSEEDAIEFCEKYGYDYEVKEPDDVKPVKLKSYSENFKYKKPTKFDPFDN